MKKIHILLIAVIALLASIYFVKFRGHKKSPTQTAPASTHVEATMPDGSPIVSLCPNMVFSDASKTTVKPMPSLLYKNACWFIGDRNQSCAEVCRNFYGVDAAGMKNMTNNSQLCTEVIKGLNPKLASNFVVGDIHNSPVGSTCAVVYGSKDAPNAGRIVSQNTYSSTAKAANVRQICSCDAEGFPNQTTLGLSYRGAANTVGKVGEPMNVKPTFLSIKSPANNVVGPISCFTDPSTPLIEGLKFEQGTCAIIGTPKVPSSGAQKFKIFAIDQAKSKSAVGYQSNAAYLALTISP